MFGEVRSTEVCDLLALDIRHDSSTGTRMPSKAEIRRADPRPNVTRDRHPARPARPQTTQRRTIRPAPRLTR